VPVEGSASRAAELKPLGADNQECVH
jgi:hypothetical protein